jgi:hypothetical protein
MCECHQSTKQCRLIDEKIEQKVAKEHGFTHAKHETMRLLQWTQKHPEWHHGMESSPHYGCNEGGGSPWGLRANHTCNVLDREPKDGGGLI